MSKSVAIPALSYFFFVSDGKMSRRIDAFLAFALLNRILQYSKNHKI